MKQGHGIKPRVEPHLIHFPQIGDASEGYISVAEIEGDVPFKIERIFWTYYTPEQIIRGRHAHHVTEMVLIAVAGSIEVHTELPGATSAQFILNRPDVGLYLPPLCWHTMKYTPEAVQLVLASTRYQAADYIRDYELFKSLS